MENKILHIVSFDNPFPPQYGGAIDVFYKIKALHQLGVKIKLHCFVNEIPVQNSELALFTDTIFYYKRSLNHLNFFSLTPLSIMSRKHKDLIYNLNSDDSPILFEGLQTTYLLNESHFKGRKIYLRLHNIEENYYRGLSKSEFNVFKKVFFYVEHLKYNQYKKVFNSFAEIFTLSKFETLFINEHYKKGSYIPVFHGNDLLNDCSAFGEYAFYNGDLRISDNKRAVQFLINVFKKIPDYKLVIASSIKLPNLQSQCESTPNIFYVLLENQSHLDELLRNAHVNVMLSFQPSGTKLKVINALYQSRFCVINDNMIDDLDIKSLCILADDESEFVNAVNQIKKKPYSDFANRKNILQRVLNDAENAKKIIEIIYG
jgi:hypothetical protein